MGSRSLKLRELGGGCSLFPRRASLLVPALASTRVNLILTEMVATAAPWEPSTAVPPTLHSHEGCWGFAVPWTPPQGFWFSRWRRSCWGRHHTLRSPALRDRGQAASIEKRFCEVSAEHRWILTLNVQERFVGKDETGLVRCYLNLLASFGTQRDCNFNFPHLPLFMWLGFGRKMPTGQFSRNQGGYVTPGLHQILVIF